MDLGEICLIGQLIGADPKSEAIFYIGGQYRANISHLFEILRPEKQRIYNNNINNVNNRVAMTANQTTDE